MWDDKLNEVVKKLSEKHKVSEFLIKDAVEHTFSEVKNSIQDPSMPKVLLHNFGTFKPNLFLTSKKLSWTTKRFNEGKINEEEYKEKYEYISKVLNRLKEEENGRNSNDPT